MRFVLFSCFAFALLNLASPVYSQYNQWIYEKDLGPNDKQILTLIYEKYGVDFFQPSDAHFYDGLKQDEIFDKNLIVKASADNITESTWEKLADNLSSLANLE